MSRIKLTPRLVIILLCLAGLTVSFYLVLQSYFTSIQLYSCPPGGFYNCGAVTSSIYSHIFGIPVALLGFLWFALILALLAVKPASMELILLPIWGVGMAFVGYLVYIELLVLHTICLYCTAAHILGALLGIPIVRLALETD